LIEQRTRAANRPSENEKFLAMKEKIKITERAPQMAEGILTASSL
jgi:hypothetical protein